jgi:hypothetical protein
MAFRTSSFNQLAFQVDRLPGRWRQLHPGGIPGGPSLAPGDSSMLLTPPVRRAPSEVLAGSRLTSVQANAVGQALTKNREWPLARLTCELEAAHATGQFASIPQKLLDCRLKEETNPAHDHARPSHWSL